VRPRAFPAAEAGGATAEISKVDVPADLVSRTKVVEMVSGAATARPPLKDAKTVVSGGRGLGGPENWPVIEELAGALSAAVGATRAVTDAGWVPPTPHGGLTRPTVAPGLYP